MQPSYTEQDKFPISIEMITDKDIDNYPEKERATKTRQLLVALEYERRLEAELMAALQAHRLTCSEHKLLTDMAEEGFAGYTTQKGLHFAINEVAPELLNTRTNG